MHIGWRHVLTKAKSWLASTVTTEVDIFDYLGADLYKDGDCTVKVYMRDSSNGQAEQDLAH